MVACYSYAKKTVVLSVSINTTNVYASLKHIIVILIMYTIYNMKQINKFKHKYYFHQALYYVIMYNIPRGARNEIRV